MEPEAARIEHLKLIQSVIARQASNSFAVKSMATAVTAALVAFIAAAEEPIAGAGALALAVLWGLDTAFLRQERRFRRLYDTVRGGVASRPGEERYFTMDADVGMAVVESPLQVACRSSLLLTYPPLMALAVGAALAQWVGR